MHLTILGATGATGRELTRQALDRGHTVIALAREPDRIAEPNSDRLFRVAVDVYDRDSVARAVRSDTTVVSGLGLPAGAEPGVLTVGAKAVIAAAPQRILWLGAYGTGASAVAAGRATRSLLRVFLRDELADKVTADAAVLEAGGTVFHAGPLSDGSPHPSRRTVGLDRAPKRLFPARVSRATVAAAMLDEAEHPRFPGTTALPLET